MPDETTPDLGAFWKDIAKGGAKEIAKQAGFDLSKIKSEIRDEIRAEIKAGMIKMFLAGMAATVAGHFIFKGISK